MHSMQCGYYHIYIYTEWLNITKKKIHLEFFSKNFNFLLLSLAILYSFKCYRLLNIDMYLRYIYIICKYIYRYVGYPRRNLVYKYTAFVLLAKPFDIHKQKRLGLEKLCSIYMFCKFTYIKLDT